ncbi:hypothetical protein NEOLEDRAFT_1143796 [Neolentinus lepideus HHB14362 ss-1]|uniref:BHLH domain-containing protein n=1 Tax=Neolentinus lepideus HHB14362 ss-1 TaxID=1314782 RepID=A0A165MBE2_9AGAM|nr:hypothetical protein NEOLEDRAFT_1143796 [Neolentinus lepideus HHB14362 ss-1]
MPLLSPAESHAFSSFLSAIDVPDTLAPEWSMYAHQLAAEIPIAGKEALTKATKDLMALDEDKDRSDNYYSWSSSSSPSSTETPQSQPQQHPRPTSRQRQTETQSYAHEPSYSFGYQGHGTTHRSQTSHSQTFNSVAPLRTLIPPLPTPTPPPAPAPSHPTSAPLTRRSSKRASVDDSVPSNKRRRSSPSLSSTSESPSQSAKPALLTPTQKKANHIQSEQKRRANIRRGYEALCDTVPALREAIAKEEEENRVREEGAEGTRKNKGKKGKKKRVEEVEKLDGRAGPRSENIVLQKTIDYITDLVGERAALLARLHRARSRLQPDHPALRSSSANTVPLWEREWTGGTGDADLDQDDD